jgi:hypothetical protein
VRAGGTLAAPVTERRIGLHRYPDARLPIPLAFALLDANHHALTVDIARAEPDRFRDPESGGVARRQDGAVLGVSSPTAPPSRSDGTVPSASAADRPSPLADSESEIG